LLPFFKKNKRRATTYLQQTYKLIYLFVGVIALLVTALVTIISVFFARENAVNTLKTSVYNYSVEVNTWYCNKIDLVNSSHYTFITLDNPSEEFLTSTLENITYSSNIDIKYACLAFEDGLILSTKDSPYHKGYTSYTTKDWYITPNRNTTRVAVTLPDTNVDKQTIFFSKSLVINNRNCVLMFGISTQTLIDKAYIYSSEAKDESLFIVDNDGNFLINPSNIDDNHLNVYKNYNCMYDRVAKIFRTKKSLEYMAKDENHSEKIVFSTNNVINGDLTIIGTKTPYEFRQDSMVAVFICLFVLIISCVLIHLFLQKKVSMWYKPFKNLLNKLNLLAKGDFTVNFKEANDYLEITELSKALDEAKDSLYSCLLFTKNTLLALNEGNLNIDLSSDDTTDYIQIKEPIISIEKMLSSNLSEVNETGLAIAYTSEYIQNTSKELSYDSENIIKNTCKIDTDIDNVSTNNTFIKYKLSDLSESFNIICELLSKEQESSDSILNTLSDIQNYQRKIYQTSCTLADISSQTDLLSLKASIEATKLGPSGKRLIKIARDIGDLTNACTKTVNDISTISDSLTNAVLKGIDYSNKACEQALYTVNNIKKTNDMIHDITNTISSQKTDIIKLSSHVSNITNIVDSIKNVSSELDTLGEETSQHSSLLLNITDKYNYPT